MTGNVRVFLVGASAAENTTINQELAEAGFKGESCETLDALTEALKAAGSTSVVVCSCRPSLTHTLGVAADLKRERPYLPVVIYDEEVREVARLRCIEQGLDEYVARKELVATVEFLGKLLATRSMGATLEEIKAKPGNGRQGEMYFQLNGDELSNALQFLCMTSREGRLSLKFDSGRSGAVFLAQNTLTHAEYEDFEGIEALAKMLSGGSMEARFFEGRKAPRRTNSRPISQVLIEASVMADEAS